MSDHSQQQHPNGAGQPSPATTNGGRAMAPADGYAAYMQQQQQHGGGEGAPLNANASASGYAPQQYAGGAQAVYNAYQSTPAMSPFPQQQPMYQQFNSGGGGGMNPHAAPFRPGVRYGQQPAASAASVAYGANATPLGGGGQSQQRPFNFNPFGYNSGGSQPQQQQDYSSAYPSSYAQAAPPKPQGYAHQQQYSNGGGSYAAQQPQQQAPAYFGQQPQAYNGPQVSPGKAAMLPAATEPGSGSGAGATEGAAQQYALSDDLLQRMEASENSAALFEIQIGLEQIVVEGAAEFETWASAIKSRLISQDFAEDDLTITAALIVEMAVLVPDCQYHFSRLCHYQEEAIGDFVLHYLLPVLEETLGRHAGFFTADNHRHLALFLAELHAKAAAGRQRQEPLLGKLVLAQLHNLLGAAEMSDALLKAAVQALKLTGRFLEAEQGAAEVDKLFERLHALCAGEGPLSESVKAQVLNLVQLRNNSWGVTGGEKAGSSGYGAGPDGRALTDEEAAFLDENIATLGADDDEFTEDYEKFLAATAVGAAEKALEKLSVDEEDDEAADTPPAAPAKPL